MSDRSAIEWTEATWNPVDGCDQISPGCAHCYAKTIHDRRYHSFLTGGNVLVPQYATPFEDVRPREDRLDVPLYWKKPRRIFVNSMSDLFHKDVPETFIMSVFAIMEKCPQHTFQILTKRAERMREVVSWLGRKWADCGDPFPLPNVWLGVSVENQHFADERIPLLLQTPAAVRFISAEPLLEAINLAAWLPHAAVYIPAEDSPSGKTQHRCLRCGRLTSGMERECRTFNMIPTLNWVIVGGESGHGARPFDLAWARSIVAQCKAAGVPVFVKQLGAHPVFGNPRDEHHRCVLTSRKGGDPQEWPEDLRVREFPASRTLTA